MSGRDVVMSTRFSPAEVTLIDSFADGRCRSHVIRACVVAILRELQRQQVTETAEFDTTEAGFDAMMAVSEPARLVTDFYEQDEPIEKIRAIIDDVTREQFVTTPPDLELTVARENGRWWAEMPTRGQTMWAPTFDQLAERVAEGLHLSGSNRERNSITIRSAFPGYESTTTSNPRVFVFREQAS